MLNAGYMVNSFANLHASHIDYFSHVKLIIGIPARFLNFGNMDFLYVQ